MFGFIKSLFVAPEAVSKVIDAVVSAGDAAIYTTEEKATDVLSLVFAGWKDQYTPRAITRRILACIAYAHFFLLIDITVAQILLYYLLGIGSLELIKTLIELIKWIGGLVITPITVFYFGIYLWNQGKSNGK